MYMQNSDKQRIAFVPTFCVLVKDRLYRLNPNAADNQ